MAKTVTCKGLKQAGHGGYTLPPFTVSFTYTATVDENPLARCIKSCLSCVAAGGDALEQQVGDEHLLSREEQKAQGEALQDVAGDARRASKSPLGMSMSVSSLFARSKTRPHREPEK